jgi:hypothetical protein
MIHLSVLAGVPTPVLAEPPSKQAWRVFLEAKFMRPPASETLANAQRTVLAAGFLTQDGLQNFSRVDFDALGLAWEDFVKQAAENADDDVPQITITYVRNRKKIIEYAEVHSPHGTVSSVVLAPTFLPLFDNTLGPEILVAVPSRELGYVFPKLASNYADYAPMVLQTYRDTTYPVTLEVFEVSATGIKAAGRYPDPARD